MSDKINLNKETFAERLQELFDTRQHKAFELEKNLDVSRATVSRWRNGHNLPSVPVIKEIANFFGVRYEWLIGRDEYKTFRDIPIEKSLENINREWSYFESLGYKLKHSRNIYEDDENGDDTIVGVIWTLTRDGVTIEISDNELSKIEEEIRSFIDFKIMELFEK